MQNFANTDKKCISNMNTFFKVNCIQIYVKYSVMQIFIRAMLLSGQQMWWTIFFLKLLKFFFFKWVYNRNCTFWRWGCPIKFWVCVRCGGMQCRIFWQAILVNWSISIISPSLRWDCGLRQLPVSNAIYGSHQFNYQIIMQFHELNVIIHHFLCQYF